MGAWTKEAAAETEKDGQRSGKCNELDLETRLYRGEWRMGRLKGKNKVWRSNVFPLEQEVWLNTDGIKQYREHGKKN